MGFSKASLWGAAVLLLTIWGAGCRPNPREEFRSELERMTGLANGRKYQDLERGMSARLKERIRLEGWEPAQALLAVAKKDREDGARYRVADIPKFETGAYAEVEIARQKEGVERRFVVPFVREEGRWKAGAAYRDGRTWEEPEF
ncbi:MAG: hypothetical protein EB090_00005 [Verrucomicrobia bacterium]|nr:hypothetical protein [Verrucomicrobiota bacterium]